MLETQIVRGACKGGGLGVASFVFVFFVFSFFARVCGVAVVRVLCFLAGGGSVPSVVVWLVWLCSLVGSWV